VPDLTEIVHSLRASQFRDLAGARASVSVPVAEALLNTLIATSLPANAPVRSVTVQPEANDRLAVRIVAKAALIPAITLKLAIESQPRLPDSPVLVLRMVTLGGLFGLASGAVAGMLPPGVRLQGERILVDLGPSTRSTSARSGPRRCPAASPTSPSTSQPLDLLRRHGARRRLEDVNNGTTWEAQLQDQGHMSIGDVTISQSQPRPGLGRHRRVEQPAERRRGATASTSPPTAARPTRTWGSTSRHINRIVIDPRDTTSCSWRRPGACGAPAASAASTRRPTAARPGARAHVDDDTGAERLVMDRPNSDRSSTPPCTSAADEPAA
jgi:hypothetical protein